MPPYDVRRTSDIVAALDRFFTERVPGARTSQVTRVGGGASKEQFVFTLTGGGGSAKRYLLRMDALEAITETDRKREFEVLQAMQGRVPAPRPCWLDESGETFGRPAAIIEFVDGVTKPRVAGKASGLGIWLGEPLRGKLKGPFLDHLVALHAFDFRRAALSRFSVPDADPKQTARWGVNYWRQLWHEDSIEPSPIMTYAEQWMLENLPECRELAFTHGDYRTGNYLFDEASGRIVAVLDWELARIGDHHEDLAWILRPQSGTLDNGRFRASDLYEPEEFIDAYQRASGRTVDRKVLHFYAVLSAWKSCAMVEGTGIRIARAQHNHQDVLLTYVAGTAAMFRGALCRLLEVGAP
jgi:aminoglycoside phosphotransferase (APT) family kinase protein